VAFAALARSSARGDCTPLLARVRKRRYLRGLMKCNRFGCWGTCQRERKYNNSNPKKWRLMAQARIITGVDTSDRKAERQAGQRTLRPLECTLTLPLVTHAFCGRRKHAAHAACRAPCASVLLHAPGAILPGHACLQLHRTAADHTPQFVARHAKSASIGMLPSNPMHCSAQRRCAMPEVRHRRGMKQ
jgi:hypothetical protein